MLTDTLTYTLTDDPSVPQNVGKLVAELTPWRRRVRVRYLDSNHPNMNEEVTFSYPGLRRLLYAPALPTYPVIRGLGRYLYYFGPGGQEPEGTVRVGCQYVSAARRLGLLDLLDHTEDRWARHLPRPLRALWRRFTD